MTPATPLVSVVIPTHRGERFVAACLESVRRHVRADAEVIVVDNASDDGTLDAVRRARPDALVIASPTNEGFGRACNRAALRARGELLLVLNQDLELRADLAPALARLRDDPGLGVLGLGLRYPDGRRQLSLGRELTPARAVLSWIVPTRLAPFRGLARNLLDDASYETPHADVAWVSGAAFLCRRELWARLGGMDEALFMYVEDVDLCRRTRDLGARVGYEPSVEAVHHEASGGAWVGENALRWTTASTLHYVRRHHGRIAARLLRLALGPAYLFRAVVLLARSLAYGSPLDRQKAAAFACVALARSLARVPGGASPGSPQAAAVDSATVRAHR